MVSDKEYQEYRKKLLKSMDSAGQPVQEASRQQSTQKQYYFQEQTQPTVQKQTTQMQQPSTPAPTQQQYPTQEYWQQTTPKPPAAQVTPPPLPPLPQEAPIKKDLFTRLKTSKKRLTILLIILAVAISAVFIVNFVLMQTIGIGVIDVIDIAAESAYTFENAQGIDQISPSVIGSDIYAQLVLQKNITEESFNNAKVRLGRINNNTETVNKLLTNLGNDYSIYLFSIYTNGEVTIKVFEWSVGIINGQIQTFETGKTKEVYNSIIQFDQTIAESVLTGRATNQEIISYLDDKKIKINPLAEAEKLTTVLPEIINAIPEQ